MVVGGILSISKYVQAANSPDLAELSLHVLWRHSGISEEKGESVLGVFKMHGADKDTAQLWKRWQD